MVLQLIDDLQCTLRVPFFSERMKIGEARDARHALVQARIVFHRAGAERIHAEIDRVIPLRHANKVSNNVHFADFRQAIKVIIALKLARNNCVDRSLVDIKWRQPITNSASLRTLED